MAMRDSNSNKFGETRRGFLKKTSLGFGAMALSSLIGNQYGFADSPDSSGLYKPQGLNTGTHFPAKAKRVIYLFNQEVLLRLKHLTTNPRWKNGMEKKFHPPFRAPNVTPVWWRISPLSLW